MNAQVISKIVQKCLKNRCYFYHYGFFRLNIVGYNDKLKKSFEFEAYLHFLLVIKPGVGACLKIVGSRLRSVTQKRNRGRFPVTLGYKEM